MNSEDENIPLSATPIPDSYTQDDDQLRKMVANYYIEYASYVIQDRAIPDVVDGLKPVQRRFLHCLNAIDDGRFNRLGFAALGKLRRRSQSFGQAFQRSRT